MTGNRDWRRLFVGRDEELARLCDAWRLAAPDDDSAPEPQFVVLLGESGLGKTRLVQEFYRWLSREQDPPTDAAPDGYWPDAFASDSESLDVNPRFQEDATGRGRIPWLWWGIRFERPFDRNQIGSRCGLIDYRSGLISHTGAIAAARALKQVGQDKRSKGVSVASSLAGTVAGIAGLGAAAVVGTLAGLAFTAKDLFSMRADKARAEELAGQLERSPGAAQAAEQTDLEEVALNYFRTVLDTSNLEAATVPVVLFLDDSQWADPVTLRFMSRLLAEARAQHWPLLVVATHWEVEWKQTLREPIGDVNRPPRLSAVTEAFRESDEGYSTWLDLHMLPPVPDLSGIVRSALPGLTDEQRRIVLAKAGGNPLLLEEILLFLHRRPQFFESRQLDQPLAERGLDDVRERRFQLHDLIDDRFQSLEEEVQRALGWCSEQGLSFLTEITLASAQCVDASITEERLRAALRRADWPHSLIQTFGDHGLFNRSEFRQAAFHQVAREFLHFQPEELACVQQSIRTTLTAWLLTDRIDQLPAEEQLDALLMARRSLSPDESEPDDVRKAWCRGMARLAQLYRNQYLWDQAWQVAEAWANAAPNGWPLDWLDFWSHIEMCRILRSGFEYTLANQLMHPFVDSLARQADNTADRQTLCDLSVAYSELGKSEIAEGHRSAGFRAFRLCLAIRDQIVEQFGEDRQSLYDLSASLIEIGGVDLNEGRLEAALQSFRRGLKIREWIVEQFGETTENLQGLSIVQGRVGDVDLMEGRHEAALQAFRRVLVINEKTIEQFGETPTNLGNLSLSLSRVGDVDLAEARRESAHKMFRQVLAINERIVEQFGEAPEYLHGLSLSLIRVGDVDLTEGHREAALQSFFRSFSICKRIVEKFGESQQSLYDLSLTLNRIGEVELANGCRDVALSTFRRGLSLSERNVDQFGETPKSLRDVQIFLYQVGDVDLTGGRPERALESFSRGLAISERIVKQFGETPQSLSDLSSGLKHVGDSNAQGGRREVALEEFQRSLEIDERIVQQFGESPERLRNVHCSLIRVGQMEMLEGRPEVALQVFRRGLAINEGIVENFGETPESLRDLGRFWESIGDAEKAKFRPMPALEAFECSLEIRERIIEQFGETAGSLSDLATSLTSCGMVHEAEGRGKVALETFRRSLDLSERIIELFGENMQSLRLLGLSLSRVGGVDFDEGRIEQALKAFRRDLEICEGIVEKFGETPQSLWDLCCSRQQMADVDVERAAEHLTVARDLIQTLIEKGWSTKEERASLETITTTLAELENNSCE